MIKYLVSLFLALSLSTAYSSVPAVPSLPSIPALVPIPSVTIELPVLFMPEQAGTWYSIDNALNDVNAPVIINFLVSGYGGIALDGIKFNHAVQAAEAHGATINMEVIGLAASMHAYILCYASKVKLDDGSSVFFHAIAYDTEWFGGALSYRNMSPNVMVSAQQDLMYSQCLKAGLLTQKDIKVIKNGGDVIYTKKDGQIYRSYVKKDPDGPVGLIPQIGKLLLLLSLILVFIGVAKRI